MPNVLPLRVVRRVACGVQLDRFSVANLEDVTVFLVMIFESS